MENFVRAAQLSCTQEALAAEGVERLVERVRRAAQAARLDLLLVGGQESPSLYRALLEPNDRPVPLVYLWYTALADNPALQAEDRVQNYRGAPAAGWGCDPQENFVFACPNHPAIRAALLDELRRQLASYAFDGVFLDKIRYPSPANGMEEVLSCFCPYCREKARREGLDLGAVRRLLEALGNGASRPSGAKPSTKPPGYDWLSGALSRLPEPERELLEAALDFRCRSITELTADARALSAERGIGLGLDLFSPELARLVGQDYPALAGLADWVKPMLYRYANGPAGLRLEIPSLARGMAGWLQGSSGSAERWLQAELGGLANASLGEIEQEGAPLALLAAEAGRAVLEMGATPVYGGVEAVSLPGFDLRVPPDHVRAMQTLLRQAGSAGSVLSWDLLAMPMENLLAAGESEASGPFPPRA